MSRRHHDPRAPHHDPADDPLVELGPVRGETCVELNSHSVGLGRAWIPDQRDASFPMAAAVPAADPGVDYRYWNHLGWEGDQGATPQCVAYAWIHWLEDGPTTQPTTPHAGPRSILDPAGVYRRAQEIDEWPGSNYDGTSVRAGAKVLQAEGLIDEYLWAWDVDTIVAALLTTGPVVVGTWWFDSMFFVGGDDFARIRPGARRVGGHAYLLNGVNVRDEKVRLKNSWGRRWGADGMAYLTFDDLDILIREQGEACLATEIRREQT